MNYIPLSDFMKDAEHIISNIIKNEEFTTVKTKEGNVVVMTEQQYNCLMELMCRRRW